MQLNVTPSSLAQLVLLGLYWRFGRAMQLTEPVLEKSLDWSTVRSELGIFERLQVIPKGTARKLPEKTEYILFRRELGRQCARIYAGYLLEKNKWFCTRVGRDQSLNEACLASTKHIMLLPCGYEHAQKLEPSFEGIGICKEKYMSVCSEQEHAMCA